MPVLIIFIIFSLAFYIYYKVSYFRTNKPNEKKWLSAKSTIALGAFVGLFGLNRMYISTSPTSITISIIFILVGLIAIGTGIRAYKFYLPYVTKESNQSEKES